MPPVALNIRDTAGGQLFATQRSVFCDGELVITRGDLVGSHGDHLNATMAEGNPTVTIEGRQVVRQGHIATCGHLATGSATLIIG